MAYIFSSGHLVPSSLNFSKWCTFAFSSMKRNLSLLSCCPRLWAVRSWDSLCVICIYMTQSTDECSATGRTVTKKNRKGLNPRSLSRRIQSGFADLVPFRSVDYCVFIEHWTRIPALLAVTLSLFLTTQCCGDLRFLGMLFSHAPPI